MSDLYSELLVARKPKSSERAARIAMIIVTAGLVAAGIMFSPYFLIGALAMAIADYIIFPRFNVEYEYQYMNGEIDIDEIFSKAKRKKVTSLNLANVECVAPYGSHHLDSYGVGYSVTDYSSMDSQNPPYVLVKVDGTDRRKIYLQLDDSMLNDIKMRLPRKVFTE